MRNACDGEAGAAADPALEDDRRVLVDLLRAAREPLELDVHRAGDAAGLPLVGLAHVDELRLAALDQLLHALRLEVELVSENAPMRPGRASSDLPVDVVVLHHAVSLRQLDPAGQRPGNVPNGCR